MITIILPAYNEEENIQRIPNELIPTLKKLGSYEIIIVDDGSKDDTIKTVKKLRKKYPIKLIIHKKNQGLGMAVRTGINNASGDIIITLDTDFTFHPRQIPKLLKVFKQGNYDCVIGSPYLSGYGKDIPKHRIFLSQSCNLIYSVLLGKKTTAASPIFRIYNAKKIKKLKLKSTGFDINAEILLKLIKENSKIIEVPAKLTNRIYGESKLNTIKQIKNHLKIYWNIIKWRLKLE